MLVPDLFGAPGRFVWGSVCLIFFTCCSFDPLEVLHPHRITHFAVHRSSSLDLLVHASIFIDVSKVCAIEGIRILTPA
jgi:hypothetical protein